MNIQVDIGNYTVLSIQGSRIKCEPIYPFQLPSLPGTVTLISNAPVIPADERLRIKLKWQVPSSNLIGISCANEEELRVLLERRKYIDLRMMTENVEVLPADALEWLWVGHKRAESEGPLCLALISINDDDDDVVQIIDKVHFHLLKVSGEVAIHKEGLLSEESLKPHDDSGAWTASHVKIRQLLDDNQDLLKDDGPVFLAAVQQIERSVDGFRRQIKLLLRSLQSWMEAQEVCEERWSSLFDCILDTACLETSLPYLSKAWPMDASHRNLMRMRIKHEFIDPLLRLYEHEIKVADMRRREFEDAAAEYHAYEARYLKKDAAAPASRSRLRDTKYQARLTEYELKRMEYWSFLQDLQLAQSHRVNAMLVKFMELLRTPTPPADAEVDAAWQNLHRMVTVMCAEIERRLEEREQRHKLLEDAHDEALIRLRLEHMGIQSNGETTSVKEQSLDSRQREGFLNVLRPDQRSFKRYWCVLASGQVFEYSIDRERRLKLSEVFSLENCTVREARDQDRRFCLEIISPHFNPARLYQARGEEERGRWLRALQSAAISWIDGSRSPTEAERLPQSLQRWPSVDGNTNNGEDSESLGMVSPRTTRSPSLTNNSCLLLEELRVADELNRACADCGRPNPEWISINLGVIICIECSGIHRSLGSHISKVRSLTLDTAAFTPSLQQRIRENGGNLRMNAYYEARLGIPEVGPAPLKPDPTSPHALKEQFIRAKYERLLWIPSEPQHHPTGNYRSSLDDLLLLSDNEK